jgi:hypothetical protein
MLEGHAMDLIIVAILMINLAIFIYLVERNVSLDSPRLDKQIAVVGVVAAYAAPTAVALGLPYVALAAFIACAVLIYEHPLVFMGWAERAFGSSQSE